MISTSNVQHTFKKEGRQEYTPKHNYTLKYDKNIQWLKYFLTISIHTCTEIGIQSTSQVLIINQIECYG